ncbi:uncharacterized protein LOC129604510 isoform X2 [Betta splendens]|uniref:Uncharacterized protein LOC129604510 isoform X2 n=1 Tax=Betta splendens TaxID=158456 RepID=A0A9W2XZ42_BETSP|nr:uncharacterized protein LOC129604510 isoform X2 [Betta splendens]XP_055367034.1 uncharacterized protein LOC129604510 isoform X2 [Betta splendens]
MAASEEDTKTFAPSNKTVLQRLNISENSRRSLDIRMSLIGKATENCQCKTVHQWLRDNSQSDSFSRLVDMVDFLQKHIHEAERKSHGACVDITFWAHGSIGLPLIPASCLMPLPTVRDVVLYAPWNCITITDVTYGVATGRIQPQRRVFYCRDHDKCPVPDGKHRPTNLPDRWNSLKEADGWKIPTIVVSPLEHEDGAWNRLKHLIKQHGSVGRNRILIPFILPGQSGVTVPFPVVTLALSLVLLSSRFKATIHLAACLRDPTGELTGYQEYLKRQYAYATDNTGMEVVFS